MPRAMPASLSSWSYSFCSWWFSLPSKDGWENEQQYPGVSYSTVLGSLFAVLSTAAFSIVLCFFPACFQMSKALMLCARPPTASGSEDDSHYNMLRCRATSLDITCL